MDKLRQAIRDALIPVPEMWDAAAGEFNYPRLFAALDAHEPALLGALLGAEAVRARFFVSAAGAAVFKAEEFRFFMEENKLDNSYTVFANRIGLSAGGRKMPEWTEVVLDFPFKDCVFQGEQGSEKGDAAVIAQLDSALAKNKRVRKAGRKEIFFNEVLAADEITRLFEEKALTGWRRVTKDGEVAVGDIRRDAGGVVRENMIIRGNNLLALHSIFWQFAGKVKLVYIDPPYNTGGDANIFTYNNHFNHSTWLTFMKNRLEIARELMREDGFIAIAIDHFELLYLGVLADQIFGRDNRLGIFTVVHKPEGRQFAKGVNPTNEFMLWYAKDKARATLSNYPHSAQKLASFDQEDARGKFRWEDYVRLGGGAANLRVNKPKNWFPVYVSGGLKTISLQEREGWHVVWPVTERGAERTWNTSADSFQKNIDTGRVKAEMENGKIKIYRKIHAFEQIKTHWVKPEYNATKYGTRLLNALVGPGRFSYPKSLHAVVDVLSIMTGRNDIILDFFGGSGTTAHACLHLNQADGGNRKFILIEQLGEHIDVCVERNQKVLNQENLSGDFLYCELAQWNEAAKRRIVECADLPALLAFFEEMRETYFLDYNFNIKKFADEVAPSDEFAALPLDEQKRLFAAMLDLNMLYVPRREMLSEKFGIGAEDARCTNDFYGIEEEEEAVE